MATAYWKVLSSAGPLQQRLQQPIIPFHKRLKDLATPTLSWVWQAGLSLVLPKQSGKCNFIFKLPGSLLRSGMGPPREAHGLLWWPSQPTTLACCSNELPFGRTSTQDVRTSSIGSTSVGAHRQASISQKVACWWQCFELPTRVSPSTPHIWMFP